MRVTLLLLVAFVVFGSAFQTTHSRHHPNPQNNHHNQNHHQNHQNHHNQDHHQNHNSPSTLTPTPTPGEYPLFTDSDLLSFVGIEFDQNDFAQKFGDLEKFKLQLNVQISSSLGFFLNDSPLNFGFAQYEIMVPVSTFEYNMGDSSEYLRRDVLPAIVNVFLEYQTTEDSVNWKLQQRIVSVVGQKVWQKNAIQLEFRTTSDTIEILPASEVSHVEGEGHSCSEIKDWFTSLPRYLRFTISFGVGLILGSCIYLFCRAAGCCLCRNRCEKKTYCSDSKACCNYKANISQYSLQYSALPTDEKDAKKNEIEIV